MRLSDLRNKEAVVPVTVDNQTIRLRVRVGAFTLEYCRRLRDAGEEVWEALAGVLCGWDLTDDAGVELPTSVEILRELPLQWQAAITTSIGESLVPNSPSTTGSAPS
jgi:hypothetical protein